jgi:hypothetical protein
MYALFRIRSDPDGYPVYDLKSICNNIDMAKNFAIVDTGDITIAPAYDEMNCFNNYTIIASRSECDSKNFNCYNGDGYIIEEVKIDTLI